MLHTFAVIFCSLFNVKIWTDVDSFIYHCNSKMQKADLAYSGTL